MPKISQLPQQSTPTINDKAPIVSGGVTDYVLLSDLITLFFANATGANSPVTRQNENQFDYIVRNTGVITADNAGVNKNYSMSAMTVYINGRRISILAVAAQTVGANKDRYVDILDNTDGTGTIVNTEVANNAASPTLAANSVRAGIVVAGATTIAAAASVNQGQEDRILPIASSIPYATTDSIGNLICPRDPNRRTLGYKIVTSQLSTSSATAVQMTGLTCPVIVPLGRKIEIDAFVGNTIASGGLASYTMTLWDGTVASGTQLQAANLNIQAGAEQAPLNPSLTTTPASASKTYNAGFQTSAFTLFMAGSSTIPAFIRVRLA